MSPRNPKPLPRTPTHISGPQEHHPRSPHFLLTYLLLSAPEVAATQTPALGGTFFFFLRRNVNFNFVSLLLALGGGRGGEGAPPIWTHLEGDRGLFVCWWAGNGLKDCGCRPTARESDRQTEGLTEQTDSKMGWMAEKGAERRQRVGETKLQRKQP